MDSSSTPNSQRKSDKKSQKSDIGKLKAKIQKKTPNQKQANEASDSPLKEITEKTLIRLNRLGSQKFALSPFSQYFDEWLKNVRAVISEFESHPDVNADVEFTQVQKQIIDDVERELSQIKLKEASLLEVSKDLFETNHSLHQLEAEYSTKTRSLSLKKNSTLEGLSLTINVLKEELVYLDQMKTSFFNPLSKKIKTQKIAEAKEKLEHAQSEMGIALQNFKIEQEKLHDQYTNDKQAIIARSQMLRKDVEKLEIDSSVDARKNSCDTLSNAINALLQRKHVPFTKV